MPSTGLRTRDTTMNKKLSLTSRGTELGREKTLLSKETKTTVLYVLLLRLTLPRVYIRADVCQWKLKSQGRFLFSGSCFILRCLFGQGYKQSTPATVHRARGWAPEATRTKERAWLQPRSLAQCVFPPHPQVFPGL